MKSMNQGKNGATLSLIYQEFNQNSLRLNNLQTEGQIKAD